MRVFLTGGTGLVGTEIARQLLGRGEEPVILTRRSNPTSHPLGDSVEWVQGNPNEGGDWLQAVDGCDAAINLAGENLFSKRWSAQQKRRLYESRVNTTTNLVQAIEQASHRPSVLVSTSAVGYYGSVPEGELTESSPPGDDFLAETSLAWEQSAQAAEGLGVRVILLRVGIVLSLEEGALAKMLTPFRLGVGGPLGNGKQWMSWIHIQDLARLFLWTRDNAEVRGPVNGTAPHPVRNKEFSQTLAKILHRPCLLPAPGVALRLALGEVADVILNGQKVLPQAALDHGFEFRFSDCEQALRDLLESSQRSP